MADYSEPSALGEVYSPGGGVDESSADGPPPLVRNSSYDHQQRRYVNMENTAADEHQQYATVVPETAPAPVARSVQIVRRRERKDETLRMRTITSAGTNGTSSSGLDNLLTLDAIKKLKWAVMAIGVLGLVSTLIAIVAISGSGGGGGEAVGVDGSRIGDPVSVFLASTQENMTVTTVEDIVQAMNKVTGELDKQARTIRLLEDALRQKVDITTSTTTTPTLTSTTTTTTAFVGKDCGDILAKFPDSTSGIYLIDPGDDAGEGDPFSSSSSTSKFFAYCDMVTEGGGWTLIESYDLLTLKDTYSKLTFKVDSPRNEDTPPETSSCCTDEGSPWDDYRLSKARMDLLMERSTQMHARCHRDFAQSSNDYMIGDVSLINHAGYGGVGSAQYGDDYNMFSLQGRVRGMDLSKGNWKWFHGGWHAGFDISGKPGSVSSEDSFTYHHDGGLNPNHKCHAADGDTTWWVRSFGGVGQKETPGKSCFHVLTANPATAGNDGPYWLDLDNGLQRLYCEMSTHGGGWTLVLAAALGVDIKPWGTQQHGDTNNCISKQEPTRHTSESQNFKLDRADVNGILTSWKVWGKEYGVTVNGDAKGYWTTTPGYGTSGSSDDPGLGGAQIFHKSSCIYNPNRLSAAIKDDPNCVFATWLFDDPEWRRGGHWHDNKACYASHAALLTEGDHGTGGVCFEDGRGLGQHCPSLAPFHRGWCPVDGSGMQSSWGLMFVKG